MFAQSSPREGMLHSLQPENRGNTIIQPGMYAADTMNISVYQAVLSHIPDDKNLFTGTKNKNTL
jgi:hypothetical protein